MHLNEADWRLIVKINDLLKVDSPKLDRLTLYEKVEGLLKAVQNEPILFQKDNFSEADKVLLSESMARFAFLIREPIPDDYEDPFFVHNDSEALINLKDEEYLFAESDNLKETPSDRKEASSDSPKIILDNLDTESDLSKMVAHASFGTIVKIYETAFEHAFFPKNVPIYFFEEYVLDYKFKAINFMVYATSEPSFSGFLHIINAIILMLRNLGEFYITQSPISEIWNPLLIKIGNVKNLETSLSLVVFNKDSSVVQIKGIDNIRNSLTQHKVFFVAYPRDLKRHPLLVKSDSIMEIKPKDVLRKRASLYLLHVFPRFILSQEKILDEISLPNFFDVDPDEEYTFSDNISHAVSGMRKFLKDQDLPMWNFRNITPTKTHKGRYQVDICEYPFLIVD